MARRKPLGVYARYAGDWFNRKSAAAVQQNAGSAGVFSYTLLYNDSTTGEILQLNSVMLNAGGADTTGFFETFGGLPAAATGKIAGISMFAGSPQLSGSTYKLNPAAQIGTIISSGGARSAAWQWPYNWPLALIPPGYSLMFRPAATTNQMNATYWWTVLEGE